MEQLLEQLNTFQKEAVEYNDGPSLVIAGAGSGKTRVLTYKIAYLILQGIFPNNILALTFTNKAAREMRERIIPIVGEDMARSLWMGTFHSVFSRILRREADKIGYNHDFTIYDASDSKNLIKSILKEMALDDKIYKPSTVQARISKMKNALITPEQYAQTKDLIQEDFDVKRPAIRNIYQIYWNRCQSAGVMDFDDLLLKTYQLFKEFPAVLSKYKNIFRFILVDEYQDTNSAQHEIVKLLAEDHHRVCVVGDDAQSIYSFRGAVIGNILNFRNTYPEAKLFKLEQNYRSTQTIVNAANSLIHKNKEQIYKDVFSKNHEGEKIQLISAYSDMEEAHIIASRISEMRMLNHDKYNDFAILYRTNAQSRSFEESLRKRNIPYRIYGGLSFYQRKEVKDIIAYFRLITNPNDEEAFKRIVNYPARGIGDTTVSKIGTCATTHNVSFWNVICNPLTYNLPVSAATAKKLTDFRDLIEKFIKMNTKASAYELGEAVVRQTGLVSELYQDKTPEGLSRIQNVEELINSLHTFVSVRQEEGVEQISMGDFLAEISLMTDQDSDKENENDRVTMMTIHSAKGLEFKNVFVVGLEEDLFPSSLSKDNPSQIEEERRLFYVAITRAEETCVLSFSKSRFLHGKTQMQSPSRFLKDIDKAYLKMPADLSFGREESLFGGFNRFEKPSSFGNQREHNPYQNKYNSSQEVYKKPWEKDDDTNNSEMSSFSRPRKLTKITSTSNQFANNLQHIGDLAVGNTIKHDRFGIGKVIALEGSDDNAKATIHFETFGSRQLLLKFAKYTII